MSDVRSIVDRELERVQLRPFTLEAFYRRRERKRRNQRIAAGAVGLAIAIALSAIVIATSIVRSSRLPANTPSPIPAMHAGGLTFATGSRGVVSGISLLDPDAADPQVLVSGNVIAFDWSPDGNELAYMLVHKLPGSRTCSLRTLDVGARRSRTLASCGGYGFGALIDWDPDGTLIAFSTGGAIHVIAPDGTGERIMAAGSSPTWSPDGQRLAFIGVTGALEVLSVAAGDGTEPITVAPGDGIFAVAWSPDGTTFAVLRDPQGPIGPCRMCDSNVLRVSLIRLDGSVESKLAMQRGCCIGARPTMGWSPDGAWISLTGVHFQVIDVATGVSRFVDRPGMILSTRPSWRPVP